jgi:serine/threonine protein kinase/tetratricopeptide (TPR) repeat protein
VGVAQDQGFDFQGSSRFEVLSCLGAGGMGVVYEALDRERGLHVALKTLRAMTPEALLRFKNEYRAMQDLQHENLVSLGELFEEGGQWFFTMELLRGHDFLSHVRVHGSSLVDTSSAYAATGPAMDPTPVGDSSGVHTPVPTPPPLDPSQPAFDEARLRPALAQLCRGLCALHAAGMVHRDIKPSNILILPSGRLVIVDFGLVAALTEGDAAPHELRAVGTGAYMAPEQSAAERISPAADWYSVGVVLYQALTGRVPFAGSEVEVRRRKARSEPVPPHALRSDIPRDLDALCTALLHMDPTARPSGREVAERLHLDAAGARASTSLPTSVPGHGLPFVGRSTELQVLHQALADSRGSAVCVIIEGESGVGKSSLSRRFADELRTHMQGAVILSGRCYERELVPYKAFDGVVDALSRYMRRLAKIDAVALLPVRATLLAQAFPTLRQVEAVAELSHSTHELLDPQELRSRVFAALRELFTRLGERRPVVVVIDDLQWADSDSLALLREILRPPDSPAMLVVTTARATGDNLAGFDKRTIPLKPLPPGDALALAQVLCERVVGGGIEHAAAIAAEAGGHPLYIDELVRHRLLAGEHAPELHLDDALWARIERLDEPVRRILELIAVAGSPLPQGILAQASGSDRYEFDKHLATLRVAHLARTQGSSNSDPAECYHDRVREAVLAHLPSATIQFLHRRLAVVLDASGKADPEELVTHFHGAGDLERAARHAAQAATSAAAAFAFAHAARLYRLALELAPTDAPETRELRVKLGDSLANAGRGAEAAEAYQLAAQTARPAEALDLRRRAAEQLLRTGNADEGLALLRDVVEAVGMSLPRTSLWALVTLAALRARTRLVGLGYRRRDESQISESELERIDICWSASVGLGTIEFVETAIFGSHHLALALKAGEPYRVARSFAMEAIFLAGGGGRTSARSATLVKKATELADELQHPHALAMASFAEGITHLMSGRWKECLTCSERANALLRDRCTGVAWEINCMHMASTTSLAYLGQLSEFRRRTSLYGLEAQDRGDLYGQTAMRTGENNLAWLLGGDVETARREAARATEAYAKQAAIVHCYLDLIAQTRLDLYQGEGPAAFLRVTRGWAPLSRSLLLNVQMMRIITTNLRATAALAAALVTTDVGARARLLRSAARDAHRMAHEGTPWALALALLVTAGVTKARGNDAQAHADFAAAATACDAAGMEIYALVARRRQGEILGGTQGHARALVQTSAMSKRGIADPTCWARMLAPST